METREKKRENSDTQLLQHARKMYESMVDVGDNKTDVFALLRLAFMDAAFNANFPTDDKDLDGPPEEALRALKRAWKRFERERYPTDIKHHAEDVLVLWGSLLLTWYPQSVITADVAQKTRDSKKNSAIEKAADFLSAAKVLFPGPLPKKIADLPKMNHVGTRIGCLCILTKVATDQSSGTEYFLGKLREWETRRSFFQQNGRFVGPRWSCVRDLLQARQGGPSQLISATTAAKKACHVQDDVL